MILLEAWQQGWWMCQCGSHDDHQASLFLQHSLEEQNVHSNSENCIYIESWLYPRQHTRMLLMFSVVLSR